MIKSKMTLCIRLTPDRLAHMISHFFTLSLEWVWEGFTIVTGIRKDKELEQNYAAI